MITLNLIPPTMKRDLGSSQLLHHVLNSVTILAVIILIGTGGMIGGWVMLSRHASTVKAELQQLQQRQGKSDGQDITTITSRLNSTIKTLDSTLGWPRSWGSDLATILTGLPSTISISNLTVQSNGQFHLMGVADSRQSFVQLQTALKANAGLSGVTTSSTASKRTAVPFDFSGKLADLAKP